MLNHHSIGIDYVFFRWRYENDSIVDGIEYSTGYDAFSIRQYINLDYHYYLFKNMTSKHGIDPYANAFVKMGQRKIWSEDPYTFVHYNVSNAVNTQESNFADYGFAIGIMGGPSEFGVDVNIGIVKSVRDIWYERGSDYEAYNFTESDWLIHMRLNLYIRFLNF
ncbi:MAG: hypothetical protein GQ574_23690 [Crocinitomix sp.]|nr:hypothetical protein [Crocinitomix sp.]